MNGWRKLPHIDREVQRLYDYPQQFAEDIYDRIEQELRRRDSNDGAHAVARTGRLYIVSGDDPQADSKASAIPELPARYFGSSDRQIVAAHKAEPHMTGRNCSRDGERAFPSQLRNARRMDCPQEGPAHGGLGSRDAKIVGLPAAAAEALTLMCPALIALPENAPR